MADNFRKNLISKCIRDSGTGELDADVLNEVRMVAALCMESFKRPSIIQSPLVTTRLKGPAKVLDVTGVASDLFTPFYAQIYLK